MSQGEWNQLKPVYDVVPLSKIKLRSRYNHPEDPRNDVKKVE
jgi:hypothetical protein